MHFVKFLACFSIYLRFINDCLLLSYGTLDFHLFDLAFDFQCIYRYFAFFSNEYSNRAQNECKCNDKRGYFW